MTQTEAIGIISELFECDWKFEDAVKCKCGGEYCHLTELIVLPCSGHGDSAVVISSEGVTLIQNTKPLGRGVVCAIVFHCEEGHSFAVGYRFHKGNTHPCRVELPDDQDHHWPPVIWRD